MKIATQPAFMAMQNKYICAIKFTHVEVVEVIVPHPSSIIPLNTILSKISSKSEVCKFRVPSGIFSRMYRLVSYPDPLPPAILFGREGEKNLLAQIKWWAEVGLGTRLGIDCSRIWCLYNIIIILWFHMYGSYKHAN